MFSTRRVLALILAVLFVLSACSGGGDGDGESSGETDESDGGEALEVDDSEFVDLTGESVLRVDAADNTFDPQFVEISPGTEVTWENVGRNEHNVTPVEEDSFEGVATEQFGPGASYAYTFEESSDYAYYCTIHGTPTRGQRGVIRVVEG